MVQMYNIYNFLRLQSLSYLEENCLCNFHLLINLPLIKMFSDNYRTTKQICWFLMCKYDHFNALEEGVDSKCEGSLNFTSIFYRNSFQTSIKEGMLSRM